MSSEVDIIVKAIDKTGGIISGVKNTFTELNQGLQLVKQGLQEASKLYDSVITDTSTYISSVSNMSRVLGLSTEETSKLMEATQDLFIDQDKLRVALLAATRKGIDVSIEGLKKLSTQYLELEPGLKRTQFLLQTFGRSGADMGKLMELGASGIEKAVSAVQGGLVITKEAAAANKQYKNSVEELDDAWKALKITIGTWALPNLSDFLTMVNGILNAKSYDDASAAAANYFNKMFEGTAMESEYSVRLREHEQIMTEVLAAGHKYFAQLEGQERAAGRLNAAMDTEDQVFERTAKAVKKTADAFGQAAYSSKPFVSNVTTLANIDPSFGDKIAGSIDKIKFAMAGGTELQGLYEQVLKLYDMGKMKGPETKQWLADITAANAALSVKTGELTAPQAAQVIKDTLGVTMSEATTMLNNWIKNYDGKVMNMTVAVNYTGFSGGAYSSLPIEIREQIEHQDLNHNGIVGRAGGGPVWANKPYWVGEEGIPELFVPHQNGDIVPAKKLHGTTINFYGDSYFSLQDKEVAENILRNTRVSV